MLKRFKFVVTIKLIPFDIFSFDIIVVRKWPCHLFLYVVNVEHVVAYEKLHFYVIAIAANGFCYKTPISITLLIILKARGRYRFTE
jgi:hypothetical protein